MNISKSAFITAHTELYGTSKKESERIYKELKSANRIDTIELIIEWYYNECKKAFYND